MEDGFGRPVAGALVSTGGELLGLTGPEGALSLDTSPDSIGVDALGYDDWAGPWPEDGVIMLSPVPVPSGVVVSVRGSWGTLRQSLHRTTLIDGRALEDLAREGLGALARSAGGVYAREYGGAMPVVSVSVRGADPGQVGYLLDGHSLESSMDGLPGHTLDLSVLGGIELARGVGPGLPGGGMAGTLNLLPRSPGAPPSAELRADDRGGVGVSAGAGTGTLRVDASVARRKCAGGSGASLGTVLMTGIAGGLRGGILASASSGSVESPEWSLPSDGWRCRSSVDGWASLATGRLRFRAGGRLGRMTYEQTVPQAVSDTHEEASCRAGISLLPGIVRGLVLGGTAETSRVSSTSIGERGRSEAGLSAVLSRRGSPSLDLAVRGTSAGAGGPMVGARLGVSVQLADSALVLSAAAGRGFRRPTLNELYWPEDAFARGNPELEPETSLECELSAAGRPAGWLDLYAAAFMARTEGMIRWEPGDGGRWTPVNIGVARRMGLEGELRARAGFLRLRGCGTLMSVTDETPHSTTRGMRLPYSPGLTWGLSASLRLAGPVSLRLGAEGTGYRYTNYSETAWLSPYGLLSAGVDVALPGSGGATLSLDLENLTDVSYMETGGYPGRSRTLSAALRWDGGGDGYDD